MLTVLPFPCPSQYVLAVPFSGLMLLLVFGIKNININPPAEQGGKNGKQADGEAGREVEKREKRGAEEA
jgi:hypothetical protein